MARHARVRGALRGLPWLLGIGVLVAALVAAWPVVAGSGMDVTVSVDGFEETVRTSRSSVAQLLTDLGVRVRPEDRVTPALDTPVTPGMAVTIRRARLGAVEADGTTFTAYTHASDVGGLLADVGLDVAPHDELWMAGAKVARDAPLSAPVTPGQPARRNSVRGRAWVGHEPQPVRLSVRRAVPLVIDDGSVPFTIFTTAPTVGEALLREQVTVFLGDGVQPALGSRVQAGMRVMIQRSKPVLVTADRRTVQTRTRGKTVGDALVELGVVVTGNDRVTPALATSVRDNTLIKVVRVLETMEVERDPISFASVSVPDPEMEIDNQRLVQPGDTGEHRRRFKVTAVDGQEISRLMLDDWVAAEPITRVVAYGTKIVPRSMDTPDGPITYWRKMRVYATSYSPERSGTPKSAPWYGLTRIGLPARKGLVGVDPTVIPLGTRLYVPGYGMAMAADTGSGLFGKWLDLGYSDHDFELWYWWIDVYVLDPPHANVRWVLPNWPQYPDRGGNRAPIKVQ